MSPIERGSSSTKQAWGASLVDGCSPCFGDMSTRDVALLLRCLLLGFRAEPIGTAEGLPSRLLSVRFRPSVQAIPRRLYDIPAANKSCATRSLGRYVKFARQLVSQGSFQSLPT